VGPYLGATHDLGLGLRRVCCIPQIAADFARSCVYLYLFVCRIYMSESHKSWRYVCELSFPGAGPQKGLFFPVSGCGHQFAGAPAGLIGTWIQWKQEAPILVTEIISKKSPGTRAGKIHTTYTAVCLTERQTGWGGGLKLMNTPTNTC
jgi:hypothetical protein